MTDVVAVTTGIRADRPVSHPALTDAALITAGAALTALAAQVVIPLWPVPISAQTFAVLLTGAVLGARRGALALALYSLAGLVLPVYSGGAHGWQVLASPSGGYIIAFPLAAAVTGWVARRSQGGDVVRAVLGFAAGSAVIYAVGLPWLAVALAQFGLPHDAGSVLQAGLYPFLLGDAIKAVTGVSLVIGCGRMPARGVPVIDQASVLRRLCRRS